MILKIPAIDLIGGKCVRLFKGDYGRQTTYEEDPVEQALSFQETGFQRVHLVDLEGARDGRGQNREAIRRVIEACRVPVQVGGGIRREEDAEGLFDAGASFLIVSTVALEEPERMSQWVERWGGGPWIVSLDLRDGKLQTSGWLEESGQTLSRVLDRIREWKIPQVICTDVEKDGTFQQPNLETYRHLCRILGNDAGVIAAGGVSRPRDLELLAETGVTGAVIGRALYEGENSWEELLDAG